VAVNEPVPGVEADATGRIVPPAGATTMARGTTDRAAYVIALSSVAALGGFLFGFDSGVINGTVNALAHAFGTRAATTGFGRRVGAARLRGRRLRRGDHCRPSWSAPDDALNAVLFLVSAVATGLAGSAGFFVASRLVGGLAIGAASVLAAMYIAEVAPSHMRGRLASLTRPRTPTSSRGGWCSSAGPPAIA
jgi:MFS transporter, SP family, sugar:H+ symporter